MTAFDRADYSDKVLQIARQNKIIVYLVGILGLLVNVAGNLSGGFQSRAIAFALITAVIAVVLHFEVRRDQNSHRDSVALFSLMAAHLISVWTNGGYLDPRAVGNFFLVLTMGYTAFGYTKGRQLVFYAIASVLLTVVLTFTGVLERWQYPQPGMGVGYVYFYTIAFIFSCCVFLIWRFERAQTRFLMQSVAQANQARDAESRFLSNMSHEIRNPMNGVLGLIKQAVKEDSINEIREQLQTATIAGEQLKKIVDDILDYKKIQEGEFRLVSEPFDYGSHCAFIVKLYERNAEEKNIRIQFLPDEGVMPRFLVGDKVRLGQIASNLLANAIKFTPENGNIYITRAYDYDREELTLTIRDTGIGMSREAMEKLFTRFHQAHDGTSKEYQGTGLGLAITKHLLDLMDGSISVDSAPGEGSTFTVRAHLPVDWDQEKAWRQGLLDEKPVTNDADVSLAGVRLLCVDDSGINLKVVSRPLIKAGASVMTALSATDALELVEDNEFDIVLTDISMPEMDGEQLQQALRASKPDLPVVAVTGNVLPDDAARYLSNGFVATLGKPVEIDELLAVVNRYALRA